MANLLKLKHASNVGFTLFNWENHLGMYLGILDSTTILVITFVKNEMSKHSCNCLYLGIIIFNIYMKYRYLNDL